MNKWDKHYFQLAKSIAQWSKDPSSKIGAVVIGKHGQIESQGYNGFPRNIFDTNERLDDQAIKNKYMIHAELNCVFNACLNGISLKNSTMYIYGGFPCAECAKAIVQAGIAKVNALQLVTKPNWQESQAFAEELFIEAKIEYTKYKEELWI